MWLEGMKMTIGEIIRERRKALKMTQEDLARAVNTTKATVSRWETGETTPNTETLKLLSKLYGVSINTLLGSPRQLICQCCGMPLQDSLISKEKDGSFNEDYCQWCYHDETFTYNNMDDLINTCVPHMVAQGFSEEQARDYMKGMLPNLKHWKKS